MARKAAAAKPVEAPAAHSAWRNRIIGYGLEEATQLLANPKNWRIHPQEQQQALVGVLAQVGWVQNVVVNRRTGWPSSRGHVDQRAGEGSRLLRRFIRRGRSAGARHD